jgi:cell division protein FtsL
MKKPRWERGWFSRNALLALVLVLLALVVHEIFGAHGWLALRRERREFESLQQQIQQLQQDNQRLEQQLKALKSDPKAIEKQAREQLRLARPGEIIYTLPEKDGKSPSSTPPAQENPSK